MNRNLRFSVILFTGSFMGFVSTSFADIHLHRTHLLQAFACFLVAYVVQLELHQPQSVIDRRKRIHECCSWPRSSLVRDPFLTLILSSFFAFLQHRPTSLQRHKGWKAICV
ncbi:hypothetical protein Dsin_010083 [Dipteronia sinensis]|uniref:Uncharacterized protein n=1 Tax=Dipteronia sinensis TaxID=43782 RepID=A0AAE0EC90_9ROSI|nr:hypothetical protein Dsin_010083 [Dipteronia sinensis]